jgi:hypothetical protein
LSPVCIIVSEENEYYLLVSNSIFDDKGEIINQYQLELIIKTFKYLNPQYVTHVIYESNLELASHIIPMQKLFNEDIIEKYKNIKHYIKNPIIIDKHNKSWKIDYCDNTKYTIAYIIKSDIPNEYYLIIINSGVESKLHATQQELEFMIMKYNLIPTNKSINIKEYQFSIDNKNWVSCCDDDYKKYLLNLAFKYFNNNKSKEIFIYEPYIITRLSLDNNNITISAQANGKNIQYFRIINITIDYNLEIFTHIKPVEELFDKDFVNKFKQPLFMLREINSEVIDKYEQKWLIKYLTGMHYHKSIIIASDSEYYLITYGSLDMNELISIIILFKYDNPQYN